MHGADEFLASGGVHTPVAAALGEPRVKAALAAGAVLGFPTETVWGLGVAAQHPSNMARLRRRKGRAPDKPFQLLCESPQLALALVDPALRGRMAGLAALWPGPLTLVVPAAPDCPAWLTESGAVGLRVPDHAVTRQLAQLAGGYLVGSSLNRSGEPPLTSQQAAQDSGLADLLIAGEAAGGVPSTVFDGVRGVVLRAGGLPEARLREAWACGR